jgi:hypothetical protein
MAVVKKKTKVKPKKAAADLTLWNVILSYPDLYNPKPYNNKIIFRTDVLLDADHPQLSELRKAIFKVRAAQWGSDKTEWPKMKAKLIQDGDEREDSKGYKGRFYIRPHTEQPVPVIGLTGKSFNPQLVKAGMFANVGIRISVWENEFGEGVSIYLQAVQIDTKKESLNFGGGRSVKAIFGLKDEEEGDEEDSSAGDDRNGDSDDSDTPRGKKTKKGASKATKHSEDEDAEDSDKDDSDSGSHDDSEE